ncbi:hypothetical protein BH24ACT26_BH24ACT26_04150 [soil metagenome]
MRTLRIATFNIRHGLGGAKRVDLPATAATMAACEADLIALQEVDRNLARSERVDQPRALEEMTGMVVSFFPTIARRGGHYGIALAARDLEGARFEELPQLDPEEEPRGAIVARWRGLSVIATHLSFKRPTTAHQTEALAAVAESLEPPVVILGDLNQDRHGLEPLVAAGYSPDAERHETFKPGLRGRQLDYVLAGRGATVARAWTVASDASDHVPLVAEVAVS